MRIALFAALAALCGCYRLDGFLYEPVRTDAYEFEAQGTDEGDTVSEDRIELLERIPVPGTDIELGAVYVRGNEATPRAYALFFHGKGSHIASSGQFQHVKRLANIGYDVLAIDYRGWGTSTPVAPTEAGIEQDTAAALTWLENRVGGSDRILYYGQSFGTAVATQRAVIDPPKVLVLESGFASIEEMKTDSTLMDFPDEYIAMDSWATSSRIRELQSPLLILHGLADDFVRPEFSQALHANAPDPKRLVLVEGAGHSNVAKTLGAEYPRIVHEWVDPIIPVP